MTSDIPSSVWRPSKIRVGKETVSELAEGDVLRISWVDGELRID